MAHAPGVSVTGGVRGALTRWHGALPRSHGVPSDAMLCTQVAMARRRPGRAGHLLSRGGASPMKHIHALLMTVLLSTSVTAAADELSAPLPQERRTVLGISVLPFISSSTLEVGGERVLSPRLSVGLNMRAGL